VIEELCYKPEGSGFDSRWGIFFSAPNPFSRTMTPGFTQTATEMSTGRYLGVERSASKVDSLTAICEPIVWTMWDT
jgi:hypothetical protein